MPIVGHQSELIHLSNSGIPHMNNSDTFQASSSINCFSNQSGEEKDEPKADDNSSEEQWSHLTLEERAVLRSLSKIIKGPPIPHYT